MKPLNLRNLTRGLIVKLGNQEFEYLTCDTRVVTFRRLVDGQLTEFELSRHNDVLAWNGYTFQPFYTPAGLSHFVDCPNGDRFRKGKR